MSPKHTRIREETATSNGLCSCCFGGTQRRGWSKSQVLLEDQAAMEGPAQGDVSPEVWGGEGRGAAGLPMQATGQEVSSRRLAGR